MKLAGRAFYLFLGILAGVFLSNLLMPSLELYYRGNFQSFQRENSITAVADDELSRLRLAASENRELRNKITQLQQRLAEAKDEATSSSNAISRAQRDPPAKQLQRLLGKTLLYDEDLLRVLSQSAVPGNLQEVPEWAAQNSLAIHEVNDSFLIIGRSFKVQRAAEEIPRPVSVKEAHTISAKNLSLANMPFEQAISIFAHYSGLSFERTDVLPGTTLNLSLHQDLPSEELLFGMAKLFQLHSYKWEPLEGNKFTLKYQRRIQQSTK